VTEFKFVGSHLDDLSDGRIVAPGDVVEIDDPNHPHNRRMIDEGLLLPTAADGDDGLLRGEALQQRAAELEIEGRSSMSADELRDAVAAADADKEGDQ
jgi:hypothetical protein